MTELQELNTMFQTQINLLLVTNYWYSRTNTNHTRLSAEETAQHLHLQLWEALITGSPPGTFETTIDFSDASFGKENQALYSSNHLLLGFSRCCHTSLISIESPSFLLRYSSRGLFWWQHWQQSPSTEALKGHRPSHFIIYTNKGWGR